MLCNPELLKLAQYKIRLKLAEEARLEKSAVVPAVGGDPSAGGGQPMPPGGDPMAGGGQQPPMDPAAMQGGGGGGDISAMIQTAVQQAMQTAQPGMAAGGAGAGGKQKQDINTVAMDIFQVKKMLTHFFNMNNIPLPPDILDGPNRDPGSGMTVPPGTAGSTSDPNNTPPSSGGAGGGQGGGPNSAIQPIQPMQGAFPGADGGGGQAKTAQIGYEYVNESRNANVASKATALAYLIRQIGKR